MSVGRFLLGFSLLVSLLFVGVCIWASMQPKPIKPLPPIHFELTNHRLAQSDVIWGHQHIVKASQMTCQQWVQTGMYGTQVVHICTFS